MVPSCELPHGRNGSVQPGARRARRARPANLLAGPRRPRDHDATVLQRLPQSLDRVATELRQLVEEQDAVVREYSDMSPEAWLLRLDQRV
jgi:hypothetical protein